MKDVDLQLTRDETESILNEGTRHVFRSAPLGRAWDTFHVNGKQYELIDISERPVGTIARKYYRLEACGTPEDFILKWKAGHAGQWAPEQVLYIHWFRDVTEPKENDLI